FPAPLHRGIAARYAACVERAPSQTSILNTEIRISRRQIARRFPIFRRKIQYIGAIIPGRSPSGIKKTYPKQKFCCNRPLGGRRWGIEIHSQNSTAVASRGCPMRRSSRIHRLLRTPARPALLAAGTICIGLSTASGAVAAGDPGGIETVVVTAEK